MTTRSRRRVIPTGGARSSTDHGRGALRRVLARRHLLLTPDQDARIEHCIDPATLERWHDQAITAATAAEALE